MDLILRVGANTSTDGVLTGLLKDHLILLNIFIPQVADYPAYGSYTYYEGTIDTSFHGKLY
jgi:hypothetical protein